jgi:uncharacterized damage-inducible protein DinB
MWKPHEKSMTLGQLSLHIAQVPFGVLQLSMQNEAAPPDMSSPPQPANHREIIQALEHSAAFVRKTLPTIDDARMNEIFRIAQGGRTLMAVPRSAFLRSIMLNHWYQHRGQLGVYLRLTGAKVPSSYGPSGDEPFGG